MKKMILVILVVLSTFTLSGCFENFSSDDKTIVGEWYDTSTKTYLMLDENKNYTIGYGIGGISNGGKYELQDNTLILSTEYSVFKNQKTELSDDTKAVAKTVYNYQLDGDSLNCQRDKTKYLFSRVTDEMKNKEKENEVSPLNELIGKWVNTKEQETITFKDDGKTVTINNLTGTYEAFEDHQMFFSIENGKDPVIYKIENKGSETILTLIGDERTDTYAKISQ